MRKGISPIVAIVLLIAIAVIASVAVYFWISSLTTRQPTPDKPIPIAAQTYRCVLGNASLAEGDNITVFIQNLDSERTVSNATTPLKIIEDDGETMYAATAPVIVPSGQEAWVFTAATGTTANLTRGRSYVVYGTGASQASVQCGGT